jgi:hypothetical protein
MDVVEHPYIRYVVDPTHLDKTLTGAKPRKRHHDNCVHFESPEGVRLGKPVLATPEQMRTLKACKDCVASKGGGSLASSVDPHEARSGGLCARCRQLLPLTGQCENCDG